MARRGGRPYHPCVVSRREGAVEAGRLREAAARLRHDLGKAVRFSAPEAQETSAEPLRARLRADVLETRSGPGGKQTAAEVFDAWRSEERSFFPDAGPLGESLGRIAAAVEILRRLGPRLASLSQEELGTLDEATREIAVECRRLEREAARAEAGGPL